MTIANRITTAADMAPAIAALHGVMMLAIEPDGSAVRHLLGSVREDRHRAAGLALQLASDVLAKD